MEAQAASVVVDKAAAWDDTRRKVEPSMEMELDMVDKQKEWNMDDNNVWVLEMVDNKDQDLDKMDNLDNRGAMMDMALASCHLEESFQVVTSLNTLDTDNAGLLICQMNSTMLLDSHTLVPAVGMHTSSEASVGSSTVDVVDMQTLGLEHKVGKKPLHLHYNHQEECRRSRCIWLTDLL